MCSHCKVGAHQDAALADAVPVFVGNRAGATVPSVLPRTAHLQQYNSEFTSTAEFRVLRGAKHRKGQSSVEIDCGQAASSDCACLRAGAGYLSVHAESPLRHGGQQEPCAKPTSAILMWLLRRIQ